MQTRSDLILNTGHEDVSVGIPPSLAIAREFGRKKAKALTEGRDASAETHTGFDRLFCKGRLDCIR